MAGVAYATGKYAWGQCGKCGLRYKYLDLVSDGQWRHLQVCPQCYDPRHPQERLIKVSDPVALFRATAECTWPPTAPVLSGVLDGTTGQLSWTSASSPDSAIGGYRLFRTSADGVQVQIADLPVQYNWIREIEFEPLSFDDEGLALGSHDYVVYAYDLRGFRSPDSNIVTLTVTSDTPDPPALDYDIFTLKALDHFNFIDTSGDVTMVEGQYGPSSLGGFNTILFLDGDTFDYADTGWCIPPAGPARIFVTVDTPIPAEMDYLELYIEGDVGGVFNTETIGFDVSETGTKYSVAAYDNVQLIELRYTDEYPNPLILVPATLELGVGFEEA